MENLTKKKRIAADAQTGGHGQREGIGQAIEANGPRTQKMTRPKQVETKPQDNREETQTETTTQTSTDTKRSTHRHVETDARLA